MKKKNGFSLVEILAIIVIVGIISGVAIFGITKLVDTEDTATNKTLNQKIENAVHLYAAKYYAEDIVNCSSGICEHNSNEIKISLQDLAEDGLLKLSSDECHDNNNIVPGNITISNISGTIKYNYEEISDKAAPSVEDCYVCENGVCTKE